jgi:hypothetical protein
MLIKHSADWFLKVPHGTNNYFLKAEQFFINNQIEQIKITGEGVSIILQSNRPLIENIGSKQPITWKVIDSKLDDEDSLEYITRTLEVSLKTLSLKDKDYNYENN